MLASAIMGTFLLLVGVITREENLFAPNWVSTLVLVSATIIVFVNFYAYFQVKKNNTGSGTMFGTDNPAPGSNSLQPGKAADERFEAFMKNSPAVAWIKDNTGRYTRSEEHTSELQ